MIASLLETTGTLFAVVTPLAVVPLTILTFYLRSLREHQITRHADLERRVDALDEVSRDLRTRLADFDRHYTTKEEWLRECMHARHRLEQLTQISVRLETALNGFLRRPWSTEAGCQGPVGGSVEGRGRAGPFGQRCEESK